MGGVMGAVYHPRPRQMGSQAKRRCEKRLYVDAETVAFPYPQKLWITLWMSWGNLTPGRINTGNRLKRSENNHTNII
jgi:hypothetical protein